MKLKIIVPIKIYDALELISDEKYTNINDYVNRILKKYINKPNRIVKNSFDKCKNFKEIQLKIDKTAYRTIEKKAALNKININQFLNQIILKDLELINKIKLVEKEEKFIDNNDKDINLEDS